ncbi:MAG TPA: BLUF domain-containing protein [Allosphingosinicella sp.]|nr:BLUF domain-containing protein [Allosphingosinicella sp.]
MLESRLYVSRSKLELAQSHEAVEAIVQVAQVRNAALGVTGALISTGSCFAQILEGAPAAVDQVMASICRDGRHFDVRVVSVLSIRRRRFGEWWMAYSGPSFYVNRHIKPLLEESVGELDTSIRSERLSALMSEFTAPR